MYLAFKKYRQEQYCNDIQSTGTVIQSNMAERKSVTDSRARNGNGGVMNGDGEEEAGLKILQESCTQEHLLEDDAAFVFVVLGASVSGGVVIGGL